MKDKERLRIREAQELTRRVLALVEILSGCDVWEDRVRGSTPSTLTQLAGAPDDLVWLDFGEREPETSYAVSQSTGRVVKNTCQYSYHNGSSYDDKYFLLSLEESIDVLKGLNTGLEDRAIRWETRKLQEAKDRQVREMARKNMQAHLRNRGVID